MPGAFDGRLALVTGAGRGIGAAIAEALGAEGAHVVLTARTGAELEAVEERIHAADGSATIAPMDLTEQDSIARLAQAVGERWPALDMLILNAAMLGTLTPVSQIDGKEFNRLLTLNLLAQQALIAAFDPLLRRSAAGRVIALTSGVGARPRAYWGAYGASKAALETLVTAYGEEVKNLAPLKVAIVNPGATATAMRALAYPGEDAATLKPPSAVAEAVLELLKSEFETGYRLELASWPNQSC
jgi:NAD(P)-dependent dehydrogenase (short-subunit alcohol dehydrogenase family)